MRRATSPVCSGRTMRTAMSASRCNKSSVRLESTSSMTIPGCRSRKVARIDGSTSAPTTSLAVSRTVPRVSSALPEAVRTKAAEAISIASTCGTKSSASSVGLRPCCQRVNNATPSSLSNISMWRPIVGCVRPSARPAPDRLPSRTTARNERQRSQSMTPSDIRNLISKLDAIRNYNVFTIAYICDGTAINSVLNQSAALIFIFLYHADIFSQFHWGDCERKAAAVEPERRWRDAEDSSGDWRYGWLGKRSCEVTVGARMVGARACARSDRGKKTVSRTRIDRMVCGRCHAPTRCVGRRERRESHLSWRQSARLQELARSRDPDVGAFRHRGKGNRSPPYLARQPLQFRTRRRLAAAGGYAAAPDQPQGRDRKSVV